MATDIRTSVTDTPGGPFTRSHRARPPLRAAKCLNWLAMSIAIGLFLGRQPGTVTREWYVNKARFWMSYPPFAGVPPGLTDVRPVLTGKD
jgi:hypothetical protein